MPPKKSKITEAIVDLANDKAKANQQRDKDRAAAKPFAGIFKPMSFGSGSEITEVIPTGLEVLDRYILGMGGWPVKRMVEIFSDPSAGKTSLSYAGMASAQREGGMGILIETEDAVEVKRAQVFGVDLTKAFLAEPETIEQVLVGMRNGLEKIPLDVGPNFMALDSLASANLRDIWENGMESGGTMGKKAALMALHFPPLVKLCKQKRTALIVINQTRTKIGLVFGNPTTTPGGETHKFAASVRLQLWAGSRVKRLGDSVGIDTTISAIKNKISVPHKKTKVRLLFENGWDDRWSTINHAKNLKLIDKGAQVSEATHVKARKALGWEGPVPLALNVLPDVDPEDDAGLVDEDDEDDE